MIIIDQLRISDDGFYMYIDAHVNEADYFDNIYIDKLYIKTADQVSENDTALSPGEYIHTVSFDDNTKEIHLYLNCCTDLSEVVLSNFSNGLFFVYIIAKGTPDECTPCILDNNLTIGATFDTKLLYQNVMNYTKELADDCEIPKDFIDFILNFNAFKASIETDHFIDAISFYNQMFNVTKRGSTRKACGCHG